MAFAEHPLERLVSVTQVPVDLEATVAFSDDQTLSNRDLLVTPCGDQTGPFYKPATTIVLVEGDMYAETALTDWIGLYTGQTSGHTEDWSAPATVCETGGVLYVRRTASQWMDMQDQPAQSRYYIQMRVFGGALFTALETVTVT